jgi:hypothetical protein
MRVSEYYELGLNQPVLEFLDVDMDTDTRVFVDPFALRLINTDWAREAVSVLQDFYTEVLHAVRGGDRAEVMYLFSHLGEVNEAHLGLSRNQSRGSGVSDGLAETLFNAFVDSPAMTSGVVDELEESILFIEGIGHDRLSDMTINIVKSSLIEFTQSMCEEYGMELIDGVDSGFMWNRHNHSWDVQPVKLPMAPSKLLLIPKAVVRKTNTFNPGGYLQHFVLPYLQNRELAIPGSPLIEQRVSRPGRPGAFYVTKKSLRQQRLDAVGNDQAKAWNTEATAEHPKLLAAYREAAFKKTQPPSHEILAQATGTPLPDWEDLRRAVVEVEPGRAAADDYHRAIQHFLNALLYPALALPQREFRIHEGRKRLDIMYANQAESGFFKWVRDSQHVECGQVVVECKNYVGPLSNPEFDQLTGRFSNQRGRLGILCYRGFGDDKLSVIRHCRDAALDGRGYVLALDDEDLGHLLAARASGEDTEFAFLLERFNQLI